MGSSTPDEDSGHLAVLVLEFLADCGYSFSVRQLDFPEIRGPLRAPVDSSF